MLDGYAFSLRSMDGKLCTIFDTDSSETRRRWLVAITYQIAVRNPLMDFPPFTYAPPLGEDAMSRTIICGDLQKRGQTGMNWKTRFFKLTPRELQYYDKDILKGSIKLDGAIVKSDEKSSTHEITIKSKSGVTIVVRAPSSEHRGIWVTTMDEQIGAIEQKVANAAMQFSAEDHALTMKDGDNVGIIEIPSVALSEAENGGDITSSQKSRILADGFNGGPGSQSLMSAFLTRKPVPVPTMQAEAPPPPPPRLPSGNTSNQIDKVDKLIDK